MTPLRWLITALSFAALIGVSIYVIAAEWSSGTARLTLPPTAHLLAIGAVALEVSARAQKLVWSAQAFGLRLPFVTAVRTSLGGDFGAAITPARSGAEPARYLILAEAKVSPASVLLILFAELFLEALSLAVVVTVVAIIFHDAGPVLAALVGVVGGYSVFVLAIGALGLLLSRRSASGPPPRWALRLRLHAGRWRVVQRWLRQVRRTINQIKDVDLGAAGLSLLASIVHVAVRLTILPALVLTTLSGVALAPLALWSFSFLYGAVVVPVPGGGGAVEMAFRAALGDVIPQSIFGAALLWWRFYTFYFYILLGALVAGGAVMRALRKEREMEEELEKAAP
ncbi:MAG: lysylphosphatidylglycerol synthase domain-containing protein [Gemmatimonadota bacterium]|nr:lysylphosphatidylglycerol synthase domain-containing protein [Gemmatimonadota bacterium]